MTDVDVFLEHYGVKGQKWGQRKAPKLSGAERKIARREVADVRKTAYSTIRQFKKAGTISEKKAAAAKYEKEVLNRIKTKEFKEAYQKANTAGKGQMAVEALVFTPVGLLTLNALRNQQRMYGHEHEVVSARQVLKEMRS